MKIHSSSQSFKRKLKNLRKNVQRTDDFSLIVKFFEQYNIWYDGRMWYNIPIDYSNLFHKESYRLWNQTYGMLEILLKLQNIDFKLIHSWIKKLGKAARKTKRVVRLSELIMCLKHWYTLTVPDERENKKARIACDPRKVVFYKKIEKKIKIEIDHYIFYSRMSIHPLERKIPEGYPKNHPYFEKSLQIPHYKKLGNMELPINAQITIEPYNSNAN